MERASNAIRRCAVYTRKSSEESLEQDFNSLHAQREASEAFIKSQQGEGWKLVKTAYDDGGLSGGNMERPALQRLLEDCQALGQGSGPTRCCSRDPGSNATATDRSRRPIHNIENRRPKRRLWCCAGTSRRSDRLQRLSSFRP